MGGGVRGGEEGDEGLPQEDLRLRRIFEALDTDQAGFLETEDLVRRSELYSRVQWEKRIKRGDFYVALMLLNDLLLRTRGVRSRTDHGGEDHGSLHGRDRGDGANASSSSSSSSSSSNSRSSKRPRPRGQRGYRDTSQLARGIKAAVENARNAIRTLDPDYRPDYRHPLPNQSTFRGGGGRGGDGREQGADDGGGWNAEGGSGGSGGVGGSGGTTGDPSHLSRSIYASAPLPRRSNARKTATSMGTGGTPAVGRSGSDRQLASAYRSSMYGGSTLTGQKLKVALARILFDVFTQVKAYRGEGEGREIQVLQVGL